VDLALPLAFVASHQPIRGKKAFQKLAYFSYQLGLPVKCSFSMYLYGPYSDEVAITHSDMIATGLLFEKDGYMLVKGTFLDKYLEKHSEEIRRYRAQLETLETRFGGMSPRMLELYATTHFLASSALRVGKTVGKEEVIREVRRAKGSKFAPEEIGRAFDNLMAWDLFKKEFKKGNSLIS